MDPIIPLILIGLFIFVIILPIAAFAKATGARSQVDDLRARLRDMDAKVRSLNERIAGYESHAASEVTPQPHVAPAEAIVDKVPEPIIIPPATTDPPLKVTPPPMPSVLKPRPPVIVPPAPKQTLSLEQFVGQKLLAWVAGLALFFGIMFFVKHYFETHSLPPAVRVGIGFTIGTGLIIAGVVVNRRRTYTVLGQTFCASGVLILYGVSWAASRGFYNLIPPGPTFAVMVAITAVAFVIAVRLNAMVVAVLGMVGGFLTPYLCRTGEDHPLALFGYIALLDIGLLMVARVRRWFFLASLGAAGTALVQFGWFLEFFHRGQYFTGSATLVPMGIVCGFIALFLIAAHRTQQDESGDPHPAGAALGLCGTAMLFAFMFLGYADITARPLLLYAFVFVINAGVLAGIVINPRAIAAQVVVGSGTFLHLTAWTQKVLKPELLGSALAIYLAFGVLHSAFPILWQRLRPHQPQAQAGGFSAWFPPLTLMLMMQPVLRLPEIGLLIWPAVLLADLLAIVLAVITRAVAPVLAALVLTLGTAAFWLLKMPPLAESVLPFLTVVGGFAVVFAIAGVWLSRRFMNAPSGRDNATRALARLLPSASASLPFALLVLATLRLPLANPTPVFGLALGLALLMLGLAKVGREHSLCTAALACLTVLEATWHSSRFNAAEPWIPLLWYLGIYAVFALYPFVFRKAFRDHELPWIAAALAAVGQGTLTYLVARTSFPSMADKLGLVPALFTWPVAAGLWKLVNYADSGDAQARRSQLACFGGVTLLFITLIVPIQFDREWITLGWACEGAALIWLFHRVPHSGLATTGAVLLTVAFVRLALNPYVLSYHARSGVLLNWHLYTYGVVAAAQFLGAKWWQAANDRLEGVSVRPVLSSFGSILLFLLLNIEIAEYFTPEGATSIVFDFGTSLARDMTYSIAWAFFALALIGIGLVRAAKGARYAGMGLMVITLLKLFLHDLASISGVYRVGALITVAVIALAASYLYQRFADRTGES